MALSNKALALPVRRKKERGEETQFALQNDAGEEAESEPSLSASPFNLARLKQMYPRLSVYPRLSAIGRVIPTLPQEDSGLPIDMPPALLQTNAAPIVCDGDLINLSAHDRVDGKDGVNEATATSNFPPSDAAEAYANVEVRNRADEGTGTTVSSPGDAAERPWDTLQWGDPATLWWERQRAPTFFGKLGGPIPDSDCRMNSIAELQFCSRCIVCIGAVLRSGWTTRRYGSANRHGYHHETLDEMEEAKNSGCQLCRILSLHVPSKEMLSQKDPAVHENVSTSGTFDIVRFNNDDIETWRINIIMEKMRPLQETIWDQSLWLHPTPVESRMSEIIESSTGSETSLDHAKQWIRTCNTTHESCKANRDVKGTPTRLVAVLPDCERLVLTRDIDLGPKKRLEYLTLSHCWGGLSMFTLLRDNMSDLMQEIPRARLTKTFKDAIDVTRRLGFDYIWIDSLCIIQDDDQDWLGESVLMSDVYGGSALTLAATGAIDGSVGCYREREPASIASQKLCVSKEGGHKYFDCYNFDIYKQGIVDSPLASRAWALQERFLTPRTVHFTAQQLIWECGEKFASETFPKDMPTPLSTEHSWFRKRKNNPNIWVETVSQYSGCALTNEKDKLIAISGISKWLQNKTKDEYLAGLWRKDIEHLLLWFVEGIGKLPETYRAPSWSWASVDGHIKWPFWGGVSLNNLIPVSHVVDVEEAKSLGQDEESQKRLVMRIRCPGVRDTEVMSILDIQSENRHRYELVSSLDVDAGANSDWSGWALPVTIRAPRRGTQCVAAGLLVRPCENGQYRRVGMFHIRETIASFEHKTPKLKVSSLEFPGSDKAKSEFKKLEESEFVISLI
ncbi:heterokaryon incompatibility protein-domain-containing protein [Xylariales sp. AK1849]|nr:heterokaryon incompatibility protein-domain-containing protein [Xylariales sp. AK1849]